ncbi:MAG: GTP pyrophosphokinase family protein [Aeromicrobium sp.]
MSELKNIRDEFTRFMMSNKFGIDEIMTKVNILKDEFIYLHNYSPIEHVNSRLKSPESILKKAERIDCAMTVEELRKNILDIAGVRITCSFIADTYKISEMLSRQQDVRVLRLKDYIANPKANGYRGLHLIVEVPVFMSDRVIRVPVEIQIRTIAMDFWASVEHKIYYKYDKEVPAYMLKELGEAARVANELDVKMERLHHEITKLNADSEETDPGVQLIDLLSVPLPDELIRSFIKQAP